MEENTQTTAIENANENANERADRAVQNNQQFEAPTTNQIEGRTTPVDVPTGEQNIPDLPVYSFFQPSESEQGRRQTVQQGQEVVSDNLDDVYNQLTQLGTQGERTIEAEQEAGIPELNTELTEVENELQAKSLQFRRERERLQTEPGLNSTQRNARLAEVSRKQNMELADLEVIRAARSNTLTNAQNLVNRKLELQFQDESTRLQGLQFIYEQNKDILTREQDKLFQQTLSREERQFDIAQQKFARTEDAKLSMVQFATQNGAPNNVLKGIMEAQSAEDAVFAAGQYGVDPVQQAQMANIYSQINTRRAQLETAEIEGDKKVQQQKEEREAESEAALSNLQVIDQIMSVNPDGTIKVHPGLSGAVGAGIGKTLRGTVNAIPFVSVDSEGALPGTQKANFISTHAQIKNNLTLENLDLMSGVLSETDIKILSDAATKLDLSLSEKEYIKEIERIKSVFNRTVSENGVSDEQARYFYGFNDTDFSDINTIYGSPATVETEFNPSMYYGTN